MNLIFLGAPGAGKGSQAVRLAKALTIPQVSTGDMLREAKAAGTELGKKAAEFMDAGKLVPDEVVIGLVEERLMNADAQAGFILDGFPRTAAQADSLLSMLGRMGRKIDHVVMLSVSEEILVKRLSGRRSCPQCKKPYHVMFSPPKAEGTCDECGVELVWREDDREESVRQRLTVYKEQTRPLVDFFKEKGVLRPVEGEGTINEVYQRVVAITKG